MSDPSNKHDKFGDVILGQQGIFGAEMGGLEPTLQKHDSVRHVIKPEGLVLEMYCPGCGTPTTVTVEYPELIAMKYGVNPVRAFQRFPQILRSPTNWRFLDEEQAWRPDMKCPTCNFNISLRLSPGETDRHLQVARRRSFLSPQLEQQASQIAAQVAQSGHPRLR